MPSTPPQLSVELFQGGFSQDLAQGGGPNWSFPVFYEIEAGNNDPAEIANIITPGKTTPLQLGSQTVTGSGTSVSLVVDLGPCTGVKIGSNPFNEPDCDYPFISIFSSTDSDTFQIACASETTSWNLDVTLEFSGPEFPPASADVSLLVDGATYKSIPAGQSNYNPSGTTLSFEFDNFKANNGAVKLLYTLSLT